MMFETWTEAKMAQLATLASNSWILHIMCICTDQNERMEFDWSFFVGLMKFGHGMHKLGTFNCFLINYHQMLGLQFDCRQPVSTSFIVALSIQDRRWFGCPFAYCAWHNAPLSIWG